MFYSETSLPTNPPLQINAPIWRRNTRPRRALGILTLMVLPEPVRPPISLHIHPRKRKR